MSSLESPYPGDKGESRARSRACAFGRIPPTPDVIVRCHLGVPQIEADAWSLTIDGLAARPLCLRFADVTAYPRRTMTSFHQCLGIRCNRSSPRNVSPTCVERVHSSPTSCATAGRHPRRNTYGRMARTTASSELQASRAENGTCSIIRR